MTIEPLAVAASLLIGLTLGLGYFAGLWITVVRLPQARRPVVVWAVSAILRVAAATAVFIILMRLGVWQLIAGVLGFVVARFIATGIWGPVREPRISRGGEGER